MVWRKKVLYLEKMLISYFKGIKVIFNKKFKSKSVLITKELTFDISSADLVFALLYGSNEIILIDQNVIFYLFL